MAMRFFFINLSITLWLPSLVSGALLGNSLTPNLKVGSILSEDQKADLVSRLLSAKCASGKSFDDIASYLGVTNIYAVQLFMHQAQLKPETAIKLTKIVPGISSDDLNLMQSCPFRSFNPLIIQEPLIYRLVEAMHHYGSGIKHLVNEKLGDGIISAIDLYMDLDVVKGSHGEDRVVLRFNGKFLPFIEQISK